MNHLVYWVWLSLRCGAGSELGSYLLKHFSSPKEIYEAKKEELLAIQGINEEIVTALMDRSLVYPQKIVEYCERVNVGILTLESANYPDRLRSIYAKPIVLYYKGRLPDFDANVCIACVGMRKCSESGERNARRLGMDLAHAGAIVVSGMASSIDTAVQSGVVEAGGHTVAVLGCGIDRIYPPQNGDLMRRIAKTGTVMTEYAPGTGPYARNFPIRNRIISGLSQGTVVVEANYKSGSLITADHAVRQGRDIFAFPGSADAECAKGTNALIRKGAKLVVCAEDILEEYELLYPDRIYTENITMKKNAGPEAACAPTASESADRSAPCQKPKSAPAKKKNDGATLPKKPDSPVTPPTKDAQVCEDATGKKLLSVIRGEMSADEIASAMSAKGETLNIGELLGTLTILEIDGFVRALPGGKYCLI
ncbi:MAG: DNA-processing protein DprA [Clostridia bacterium]|nr:DNA-processing protein DprA [Clostridia bacterium]